VDVGLRTEAIVDAHQQPRAGSSGKAVGSSERFSSQLRPPVSIDVRETEGRTHRRAIALLVVDGERPQGGGYDARKSRASPHEYPKTVRSGTVRYYIVWNTISSEVDESCRGFGREAEKPSAIALASVGLDGKRTW